MTTTQWNKERVVESLRALHQSGQRMSEVWKEDRRLYDTAKYHCGGWRNGARCGRPNSKIPFDEGGRDRGHTTAPPFWKGHSGNVERGCFAVRQLQAIVRQLAQARSGPLAWSRTGHGCGANRT